MTWVWEQSPVGGNERLTLLAIADNASDDGTNAWPSLATLARKTRLDERTVRRLQDGGHLRVEVAAGPSGTNRYAVLMSTPGNLPPGQDDPRSDCPQDIQASPPDTVAPPTPGHSYAPRTSLNLPRTSKRASARVIPNGQRPSAVPLSRGAALPPAGNAPDRCPQHPGQYADYCGPCRAEALGGVA